MKWRLIRRQRVVVDFGEVIVGEVTSSVFVISVERREVLFVKF